MNYTVRCVTTDIPHPDINEVGIIIGKINKNIIDIRYFVKDPIKDGSKIRHTKEIYPEYQKIINMPRNEDIDYIGEFHNHDFIAGPDKLDVDAMKRIMKDKDYSKPKKLLLGIRSSLQMSFWLFTKRWFSIRYKRVWTFRQRMINIKKKKHKIDWKKIERTYSNNFPDIGGFRMIKKRCKKCDKEIEQIFMLSDYCIECNQKNLNSKRKYNCGDPVVFDDKVGFVLYSTKKGFCNFVYMIRVGNAFYDGVPEKDVCEYKIYKPVGITVEDKMMF